MNETLQAEYDQLRRSRGAEEFPRLAAELLVRYGRLTLEELDGLGEQLAVLLEREALRRTLGISTSMPFEQAEGLLVSVLYALGTALKAIPEAEEAARALRGETIPGHARAAEAAAALVDGSSRGAPAGPALPAEVEKPGRTRAVEALCRRGRALLRHRLEQTRRLWRAARNTAVQTEAVCYGDSLSSGVGAFFAAYDLEYAAGETPADIDYPLAVPVEGLCGVEYMALWLERLLMENRLCLRFAPAALDRLMRRVEPEYADLPLNLFEPALLYAIGNLALGEDPFTWERPPKKLEWLAMHPGGNQTPGDRLEKMACGLAGRMGLAPRDGLAQYMARVARQNGPYWGR